MLPQIFNKQKQTKKNTDSHIRRESQQFFRHNNTPPPNKTLQTQISFHPTDTHFAKSI